MWHQKKQTYIIEAAVTASYRFPGVNDCLDYTNVEKSNEDRFII